MTHVWDIGMKKMKELPFVNLSLTRMLHFYWLKTDYKSFFDFLATVCEKENYTHIS